MKLEIYDEINMKDPVRLKLEQDILDKNSVTVVAVNAAGGIMAHLLTFKSDGITILHAGISDKLGFQLTEKNELKVC